VSRLSAIEAVSFGGGAGGGRIVLEASSPWSLVVSLGAANVHGYWDVVKCPGGGREVEGTILGAGRIGGSLGAVGTKVLPAPLS
jgi:hypothetical protein